MGCAVGTYAGGWEFGDGMILDSYVRAIACPGWSGRASPGLASNYPDVNRLTGFAAAFVDLTGVLDDLPPRISCRRPRE